MVSVNFKDINSEQGFTLDQIFPGKSEGLTAFPSNVRADWVQVYNASDDGGEYGSKYFLYVSSKTNNVERDFTWRKNATTPSDLKIKSGMAFWFYHYGTTAVRVTPSGQVEFKQESPTITIHHGYNMISAPYAAGLKMTLKDAAWWKESGATAFPSNVRADWVQAYKGDEDGGSYGSKYFLYVSSKTNNVERDFSWRQNATTPAPDPISDCGQGLWYYHYGENSFTLELPYPYAIGQ